MVISFLKMSRSLLEHMQEIYKIAHELSTHIEEYNNTVEFLHYLEGEVNSLLGNLEVEIHDEERAIEEKERREEEEEEEEQKEEEEEEESSDDFQEPVRELTEEERRTLLVIPIRPKPATPAPAFPVPPPKRKNQACFYRALFKPEHRQKYDKFRRIWTAIRNTVYSAIGTEAERNTVQEVERDPNLTIDQLREMLRNLPTDFYPGSIQELLELLD